MLLKIKVIEATLPAKLNGHQHCNYGTSTVEIRNMGSDQGEYKEEGFTQLLQKNIFESSSNRITKVNSDICSGGSLIGTSKNSTVSTKPSEEKSSNPSWYQKLQLNVET